MESGQFKICPFCKEKIREAATKCRFCGEWLEVPPDAEIASNEKHSSRELSTSKETALVDSSQNSNVITSRLISPECSQAPSTRYTVEYKGQNWEASKIQAYSPEEAAKHFVAQDTEGRHRGYDAIVVYWGRFGRNSESFNIKNLLPPPASPFNPKSKAKTQAPAEAAKLGLTWLQIWNYGVLPYCVVMLPLYIQVSASGIIRRVIVQPGSPTKSPALMGSILGFCFAAVVILGLAILFAAVVFGLHKRRAWTWKANWVAVGFVGLILLLRPNPFILGHQESGISLLSLIVGGIWTVLNVHYFRNRRSLFQS